MSVINPESINPFVLPSLPLTKWRELPNCSGVYFVLEHETVVYIGQTLSLVLRWRQHHKLKKLNSRNMEVRIAWLECSDSALLPSMETALISHFKPELNQLNCRKFNSKTGRFYSDSEPNTVNLVVRIPRSLKQDIELISEGKVANWVREILTSQVKNLKAKV